MPTVYRKRSPTTGKLLENYYCFFRVPTATGGSRQVHRATGKRTKKEATDAALLLEREYLAEAGAGDDKSAAILRRVSEAGELAMRGRLNPAKAREIIGSIMAIGQGADAATDYTLRSWITEWLSEKKITAAPATTAAYTTATSQLIRFLGDKADLHLDATTASDLREFRDSLKAKGARAKSVNLKIKVIRGCFADAVRSHALLQSPASAVKLLDENDSVKRAPFTIAEVSKLVAAAPNSEWAGVILLGLYAGLRLGDAANLKVGSLDISEGTISLIPQKNRRKGTVLTIPLHPTLTAYFEQYSLPSFASAQVFPELAARRVSGRNGLSLEFADIMEAAGVPTAVTEPSPDGSDRITATRSFHSLRHSTASILANLGVSAELRMKITGHSTRSAHDTYSHVELAPIRRALGSIPALKM